MKNLLIALLIPFIFLIASSFSYKSGITEVEINTLKTSSAVATIAIPGKYIGKDGQLLLPLEIDLELNGKMPYSITSQALVITLPVLNYKGQALLTARIGSYSTSQLIDF